jgi:FkbM family methyltransferase
MNNFTKSRYLDFVLFTGYKNDYMHEKYILQGGTFDPFIAQWMIKNIKPGWIVYDIGANMFEFTEISSRISGANGIVRSFEPQLDLVNNYKKAQELNNYDNSASIHVYPFGLGSNNSIQTLMINTKNMGAATFNQKFQKFSNNLYPTQWKMAEFEVKRFDDLGIEDEIPDLIKLDIEGGEEDLWLGANENFKKAKIIIIEMGPYTTLKFFNEITNDRHIYDIKTMQSLSFKEISSHKQYDVLLIKKEKVL